MIRTIVEGEPGIFPDPVARIMRGIGGLFRRKPSSDAAAPEAPTTAHPPPDHGAGRGDDDGDGAPDHSGEQR